MLVTRARTGRALLPILSLTLCVAVLAQDAAAEEAAPAGSVESGSAPATAIQPEDEGPNRGKIALSVGSDFTNATSSAASCRSATASSGSPTAASRSPSPRTSAMA